MKTIKKQYVGNVRDLKVYWKALQFHKTIYEIVESLPDYEQFNICDLLRKSSSSVLANLSEGNTNYYYRKEYHHLNMVLSQIGVCRSALDASRMVGHIPEAVFENADQKAEEILKMIIGMMNRIQHCLDNEQENLDTIGAFDKSTIPTIDKSEVYEKANTINVLISDLIPQYPTTENNNMKDQIVRASKSILENLKSSKANSYSQSYLDLNTALGSISETIAFCDMSVMQEYISKNQYDELNILGTEIMESVIELMNQMEHRNEQMYEEVYG